MALRTVLSDGASFQVDVRIETPAGESFQIIKCYGRFLFLLGFTFGAALSLDSVLAAVVLSKMQQVSAIGPARVVVMAPGSSCHRSVPLLFTSALAIMVAPAAVVGTWQSVRGGSLCA